MFTPEQIIEKIDHIIIERCPPIDVFSQGDIESIVKGFFELAEQIECIKHLIAAYRHQDDDTLHLLGELTDEQYAERLR